MIVSTTWFVSGQRVAEAKGEDFGLVVRSRGLLPNIWAALRSLFGGEISVYSALLERWRQEAVERMVERAEALGANAVLSMRFDASSISTFMSEIVAYGTAVRIEPDQGGEAGTASN